MAAHADLVIVGAGLAGAAAARSAAARGAHVIVLEQFEPGHRSGSSHGSARIFRRAYPDPLYVRLTGQAGELWRVLEAAAGESLLTITGAIDFGAVRDPGGLHAVLTGCGVPAELLPAQEAGQRWPQFDFAGQGPVLFHADAGVLDPDRAVAALLRLATAAGADVRFGTRVTGLAAGGDGAVVHAGDESFTAPVAVAGRRLDRAVARRPRHPAAAHRHAAAGLPLRAGGPVGCTACGSAGGTAVAGLHRPR